MVFFLAFVFHPQPHGTRVFALSSMLHHIVTAVLTAGLAFILTTLYRGFANSKASRGCPKLPGPRGWPLLGYLNAIESPACVTYQQWSEKYSKLLHLAFSHYNAYGM